MLMRRADCAALTLLLCLLLAATVPTGAARAESFRAQASLGGITASPVAERAVVAAGLAVELPEVHLELYGIRGGISSSRLRRVHRDLNRQDDYRQLRSFLQTAQRQQRLTDWQIARLTSAWTARHVPGETGRAVVLYCLLLDLGFDAALHYPRAASRSPRVLLRTEQRLSLPWVLGPGTGGSHSRYYPVLDSPYPASLGRGSLYVNTPKLWQRRRALDLFDGLDRYLDHGDRRDRVESGTVKIPWRGRTAIVKLDYLAPYASYLAQLPPLTDDALRGNLRILVRPSRPLAAAVQRELKLYTTRNDTGEQVRFLMTIAQEIREPTSALSETTQQAAPADLSLSRLDSGLRPIDKALLFMGLAASVGLDTALIAPERGPMAGIDVEAKGGFRYGRYIAVDTMTPGMDLGAVADLASRSDALVTPAQVQKAPL